MTIAELSTRLTESLLSWFEPEDNGGDAPELHLVDLAPDELEQCLATLNALGARWNDRLFYIDAEEVDVTVAERPEVATLVAQGNASHACIGAEGITVDGVELPLLEMFLDRDEIEFFWWPDDGEWTVMRVAAFFELLSRLLALAPRAKLRPDPRYSEEIRRAFAEDLGRALDKHDRIDLGGSW